MASASIVWFRDDLRLIDNPALRAAMDRSEPIVALYVFDEESPGIRALGGAAKWWLHESLRSLGSDLHDRGVTLLLRRGPAADVVSGVVADVAAGAVYWNRRYGGPERDVDAALKEQLRTDGLEVSSFAGSLLFEPWTIRTGSDGPYSVFTPFWKACMSEPPPRDPLPRPDDLDGRVGPVASDALDDWELAPTQPDWAGGLREAWTPGEASAHALLKTFLDEDVSAYRDEHDSPARAVTSSLSPHLRWGEISPYTIWHETKKLQRTADPQTTASAASFLRQVGWREFASHVLYHFPDLATKNWRSEFDEFPWPRLHPGDLAAWQRGRTGIPLVDAGMRELWATGIMHNRVRLVVGSLLTKNLMIDWRHGEAWFWDTLVDADTASNAFNWQWVAGSGADAAPYFRIFNPELQAKKFDPHGEYIRRWIPEYGTDDYPEPIVDIHESRNAALAGYEKVKKSR